MNILGIKMNEEEVQKKYAEMQLINQNFQQIQQQVSLLSQQLENLVRVNEALDSIKEVKEKTSILAPLGGGLFMSSEINKENDFLVNVGGEVLVKKDFNESKEIIMKQTEEVARIIGQLEVNLQELSLRSQGIQEELNKCVSELENKK